MVVLVFQTLAIKGCKIFMFGGIMAENTTVMTKPINRCKIAMILTMTAHLKAIANGFSGDIYEQVLFHINYGYDLFLWYDTIRMVIAYQVSHS